MIKVTRLNNSVLLLNVEKIQSVQATPDTVITFTNHDRLMVKEPVEEISQRILDYQRALCVRPNDTSENRPYGAAASPNSSAGLKLT